MNRWLTILVALSVLLTGCSNALRWNPQSHTVKSGDTLYSIALAYNLDARDIAAWNNLGSGGYIREGQKLRLTPTASSRSSARTATSARKQAPAPTASAAAPALPAPTWRWPTQGAVVAGYGSSAKTQSGIRISGTEGQPVIATAAVEVVYAGSGLKSYGQLVIVKHNETWLSAYGFNSLLLVLEGDRVTAGQQIAEMGETSRSQAQLHFEIRRNGKPVNPQSYLPPR